ncbi:exopolysaccharide transport family protein [Cesiribacter andamanensis]|uniref:Cryptic autophosphorylating protein tyrosine kinase Etk n=1 Tax=Cesiribacter andamanensis AMV16 TaxID=1279009 RepID=M7NSH0_9BACT|nr:Wzz/FepE/Etk N-terminal domain-containing protein [Cesiribacter andamanensis]EMR04640.1 cryptic autophosphorylating protein tyrosine kinase Etk [Cesiribacter andamanensis AMV16]
MDLLQIFRTLKKRLWIIILVPLLTAGIAYFFLKDAAETYKSSTQVATGFTIKDRVQLQEERVSTWEIELKFGNLIETFKSPLVVGLLSYRLILNDLQEPNPFRSMEEDEDFKEYFTQEELQNAAQIFQDKLDSLQILSAYNPKERKLIDLLKYYGYDYGSLSGGLSVQRVNYSDYIAIEFASENPKLSAFAVNTLVEEYQHYHDRMRGVRSNESMEFFTNLVTEKKKVLDEKRDLLRSFQSDSRLYNVETEGEAKVTRIAALEEEKQNEESRLMGLELQLRSINRQLAELQRGGENGGNARILELQNSIDRLNSANIGSNNPAIQDSIALLREKLKLEIARGDLGTTNAQARVERLQEEREQTMLDIQVARQRVGTLGNELARMSYAKSDLAAKRSTIKELEREVELAATEYQSAQEKFNAAKNSFMVDAGSVRQIIYGQPAIEPEPSKAPIFIGLIGMVSMVLCVMVILLVDYVDLSLKTAANLEKQTKIPVAGTLNHINAANLDLYDLFHNTHKDEGLEMFKHLLRKLRYELEETGKQVFLFTSTKQGEGKSFVIMTLAYSLSLLHKRVLIIDTNFKHNTLTESLLAKPQKTRLLNGYMANGKLLLTDGRSDEGRKQAATAAAEAEEGATAEAHTEGQLMSDEQDNYSFISPTHHTNIDIIGSHVTLASPAEVLSGKGFSSLMKELKHHYDYIFMEGASLNDYSDTKELFRYAERVVPVFSAHSVLKQMDKESVRYLRELNGNLMGSVLNKVEFENLKL